MFVSSSHLPVAAPALAPRTPGSRHLLSRAGAAFQRRARDVLRRAVGDAHDVARTAVLEVAVHGVRGYEPSKAPNACVNWLQFVTSVGLLNTPFFCDSNETRRLPMLTLDGAYAGLDLLHGAYTGDVIAACVSLCLKWRRTVPLARCLARCISAGRGRASKARRVPHRASRRDGRDVSATPPGVFLFFLLALHAALRLAHFLFVALAALYRHLAGGDDRWALSSAARSNRSFGSLARMPPGAERPVDRTRTLLHHVRGLVRERPHAVVGLRLIFARPEHDVVADRVRAPTRIAPTHSRRGRRGHRRGRSVPNVLEPRLDRRLECSTAAADDIEDRRPLPHRTP